MPRNRATIREASAAEASLVLLVRSIWRRAEPEVQRELTAALGEGRRVNERTIRITLLQAMAHPSVEATVKRAASRIVGDLRKQVAALLPADSGLEVPPEAGQVEEARWVMVTMGELRELLIGVGSTFDADEFARGDGVIRSVLSRLMGATNRAKASVQNILESARESVEVVTRRVVSGARQLLGNANRIVQQATGVTHYVWVTKRDVRVRPDHMRLDGTRQAWVSPPITDRRTGFRSHPGEARHCRCIAVPSV